MNLFLKGRDSPWKRTALFLAIICWGGDFVMAGPSHATFVGQEVPPVMVAGNWYPVTVTLRNTGSTVWTKSALFRLGSQNPTDNRQWGFGRVEMLPSDSINPGEQKTFKFTVKATTTLGGFAFQWKMVQDGGAGWFGDPTLNTIIEVRSAPAEDELLWDTNYVSVSTPADYLSQNRDPDLKAARRFSRDTVLTKIKVDVTGLPLGTWVETCLYVERDSNPAYPAMIGGYSEIAGWHAMRHVTEDDWHAEINLASTPLFIPAGSKIRCLSRLGSVFPATLTAANAEKVNLRCSMESSDYSSGNPRYRILRLPYNDQAMESSLATSYYVSSPAFPLHVKGAFLFQSFGTDRSSATASNVCLKWLQQGGRLVDKACFPDQSVSSGLNYESPAPLSLDWRIPAPDLLSAGTLVTRGNTDTGFYAVVEIPSDIPINSENIFRDYDNVPKDFLRNFGVMYVNKLTHPYYCGYLATCSDSTKIDNLMALFPLATLFPNDAEVLRVNIPADMESGALYMATVALKNTGTTVWTRAAGFRLGSQNPTDNTTWGYGRIALDPAEVIEPGEEKVFEWAVRAPSPPGNYHFQWKMVQDGGIGWFGDATPDRTISVVADTHPPTVGLTSPGRDELINSEKTVVISAVASDNVGVVKVWFIQNGVVVSTDTVEPYSYDWTPTARENGTHSWTATAFDAVGNWSASIPVSVTVAVDGTSPIAPASLSTEEKMRSLVLRWSPSTDSGGSGLTGYRVDVALDAGFAGFFDGWNDFNVGSTTTVTVSGVAPDTVYYVRVRAFDGAGNLSDFQTVSVRTLPEASPTVDTARAYPVPFRPGRGVTGVTFDRTPEGADIRLFNNDGRLVKTLAGNSSGVAIWDLTNDDGQPVASGVYVAIMEKNGGSKRFKVVVQK